MTTFTHPSFLEITEPPDSIALGLPTAHLVRMPEGYHPNMTHPRTIDPTPRNEDQLHQRVQPKHQTNCTGNTRSMKSTD